MQLPVLEELAHPEERSLWDHDVVELHSPEPTPRALTYRRRLEWILDACSRWAPTGVVLDAACAQGNVAICLGEGGRLVVGMDLRPAFLTYGRRKDAGGGTHWVAGSLEALPFAAESIGCIVLGEVLEHVAHPERLLGLAAKILVPNGVIIATTPNGDRLRTGLPNLSDIPYRMVLEDRQFQPDADGHLFLLTRNELVLAGTSVGLELLEHRYIQTPLLSGWPRLQPVVGRIPPHLRQRLNVIGETARLASRVSAGQAAVFRKH